MRSTSPRSLRACLVAFVFTLGGPAYAQESDEEPSAHAEPSVDSEAPTQTRLEDLLARVRRLEAEREARDRAPDPSAPPDDAGAEPASGATDAAQSPFVLGGYVEALYQWNFADPSNGITNYRGFDNRHATFTLANVALDASWSHQGLIGRLTLQVGHTPSTYYLAEPAASGASGANASNAELWKYVQQAYAGYRFGVGRGLTVSAGLFLSPIGPESMAVHENWNWSRSNLFFGLPFYHTGVRASYALTDAWAVTVAGYNGWNSVVDSNAEKSVSAQLTYDSSEVHASLLYFGGVERPAEATGRRAFRHLFDAYLTWQARPWLSLRAHANGGFEPTEFGVSGWAAGALYARFRVVEQLALALRADVFYEKVAENSAGRAAPIFWPAPWVGSGTATAEFRPHARVSLQLEYRHDHAGDAMYFGGRVVGDGDATPFVANRVSQDTLTLGATAWF